MKIITLILLIVFIVVPVYSQNDKYVELLKDVDIDFGGGSARLFESEIFKIISSDSSQSNIVFHEDTAKLKLLTNNNDTTYRMLNETEITFKIDYQFKNNLITKFTENSQEFFKVDVSSIKGQDILKIAVLGSTAPKLITNDSAKYKIDVLGKDFRLIIPNSPSIFYKSSEISFKEKPIRVVFDTTGL